MLLTRVLTALVALPIAIGGIVFLPTFAVAALFALLMALGAWEWGGLLRLDASSRAGFVALTLAVIALVAALRGSEIAIGSENLIMLLACLCWLGAIFWIARFPQGWALVMGRTDVGAAVGVIVLSAPVAALTYLHEGDDGRLLVLAVFFIVWAADTGAYFAGRAFGRHKLAPRVSPGKTREGAVGGVLAAMLLGWLAAFVLDYDGSRTLAFVALAGWVALMSIVGDLTISMFKRHAGLKDSGSLFPGHGGVLDRLDSVLAALPWFVIGLHALPAQF